MSSPLCRCGNRRVAVGFEFGATVRGDDTALVRGPMSVDRWWHGHPRTRRQRGFASRGRTRGWQADLADAKSSSMEDDAFFDHAHGVRKRTDVCLLREQWSGRCFGQGWLNSLGKQGLE